MATRRHAAGRACALDNKLAGSRSFRDATRVLTATRGSAAWESLGHAIAAYDIALDYAKTRIQFGRPIAGFQLVQHKLAGMLTEITAMQLYCFRMAQLQEQDRWTGQMASLAKRNHARKGRHICLDARDIFGGNGLLLENHVARHPVGATCARVLTTLLYELTRRRARYGLETMCIGGGQGLAAVFERI